MRILIAGCNGQVGSQLTQQTRNLPKTNVLALDHTQLDITDKTKVLDTVNAFKPDIIMNAAAYTAVDKAEEEPTQAFAINADGAAYLAQAAHKYGSKLLHISTDYVFSGTETQAYTEEMVPSPQSVYGNSKYEGEKRIAESCPEHIILRTSWVFGEVGHNFVKTMLNLAQSKTQLNIVSDQLGSPTYAGDIAQALIIIATQLIAYKSNKRGIYHFSGMPYTNWADFAQTIFNEAHRLGKLDTIPTINKIVSSQYPTPAKRPFNSMLNCTKIFNDFNISPSNWHAALEKLI